MNCGTTTKYGPSTWAASVGARLFSLDHPRARLGLFLGDRLGVRASRWSACGAAVHCHSGDLECKSGSPSRQMNRSVEMGWRHQGGLEQLIAFETAVNFDVRHLVHPIRLLCASQLLFGSPRGLIMQGGPVGF